MDYSRNPKVVGAFLVGFAMVSGAYVISHFGEPRESAFAPVYAVADEAPSRVFIPVSDQDADGLEDWRDQFISAPAVNLNEGTTTEYQAPETLTGQLGISIMEGLITARGASSFGKTEEMVIAEAVEKLEDLATSDTIYGMKDITVSEDVSAESIRTYGNTLADILLGNSIPSLKNELLLLRDYQENPEGNSLEDLKKLASVYQNYRDDTLNTPVPKIFVKEHLDLINVYNALFNDIDTMSKANTDPMLPFIRLKRYEDDVTGLALAFTNVYNAFVPYASVFEQSDSVMIFVNFNGDVQ